MSAISSSLGSKICPTTLVVRTPDTISADLGEEIAILDPKKGLYFGLNCVGAAIWRLLQQQKSVEQIQRLILAEFAVDEARCLHDLCAILSDLEEKGLIECIYS